MGRRFRALVAIGAMFAIAVLTALVVAPAREQTVNAPSVIAFARLYGAVRFFYPSDAATRIDWNRFAVYGVSRVRRIRDSRLLAAELDDLFDPLGPGIEIGSKLPTLAPPRTTDTALVAWRHLGPGESDSPYKVYSAFRTQRPYTRRTNEEPSILERFPPVAGAHVDFDLGAGLRARVPLTLTDSQARETSARTARMNALWDKLAGVPDPSERTQLDVRLADVVVVWNFIRHFSPYWAETGVDWDSRLEPRLIEARDATSRAEERIALRHLVADARDGHGSVRDKLDRQPRGALPLRFRVVADHVVVTATEVPDRVPLGAVIVAFDGVSASDRLEATMAQCSGTTQWKTARAADEIASGPPATSVSLTIDDGRTTHAVKIEYRGGPPPDERRPDRVSELEPKLWYVDLTRAKSPEVERALDRLAQADGVVFDVRGYPTDAGMPVLRHLIAASESDRWMHIPVIMGPFGQIAGWHDIGWNLVPEAPHIAGKVVFLTDGRAISYAESVMGYVRDLKLATIIGSTTAGTNGNIAPFETPGAWSIWFTGMRVTRHDGHSPFHLGGVEPTLAVTPTISGIRAGRDEVLARAVAFIHSGSPAP